MKTIPSFLIPIELFLKKLEQKPKLHFLFKQRKDSLILIPLVLSIPLTLAIFFLFKR